jgi:hypothetical protein
MADRDVANTDGSHQIVPISNSNSVATCLNCICLKSKLDDALLELKSLQTIVAFLQKETDQNNTELVQVRYSNPVAERSSVECDGVNSVLCDINVLISDSSSNLMFLQKVFLMTDKLLLIRRIQLTF